MAALTLAIIGAGPFGLAQAAWAEAVDLESYAGRRVLIVGGRQSAFEWAALLVEAGAAHVDVVHRHDSPKFAESEWDWVEPLVARTEQDPTWFRRLDEDEKRKLSQRLWAEGRRRSNPGSSRACRPTA